MLNAIADALLPPSSLAVVALLLVAAWRPRPTGLLAVLIILVTLSLPAVSRSLLAALDPGPQAAAGEQAIVVLSADEVRTATRQAEPGLLTLERIRRGAALARRTGLPVLVSGGLIRADSEPLATMMARSLREDFAVTPRWEEDRSLTTWENAKFSAALLRQAGIDRVYLVTHAWHMRRALLAFRRAGIAATPAPVRPTIWKVQAPDFVPRVSAWEESYLALHELVGLVVYALRP